MEEESIRSACAPGGYVVIPSSEKGYLAVNGMSYQARDSRNANSAMIVTVSPQDYVTYGNGLSAADGREDALAAELDQNPLAGMYSFSGIWSRKLISFMKAGFQYRPMVIFHERKRQKRLVK